jgi:hypothetical protein
VKPPLAFSPPRSGLMNLAVGFNPRVGAIIHHPVASATIEGGCGSTPHVTFVIIYPMFIQETQVLLLKRLLVMVLFQLRLL